VIAMAVLAVSVTLGIQLLAGMPAQARTHTMMGVLGQMNTAMGTFQAFNTAYPEKNGAGTPASDTTNIDSTANAGAASYNALVTDLAAVGIYNLPSYASTFASWTYEPIDGTMPPSYTIFGKAANGTQDVICADPVHGVVDLGAGGTPTTPGLTCQ